MLCTWKPGDIITAQHLNLMTCAINDNHLRINETASQLNDSGKSDINSSGSIDMGAFLHSATVPCESCWNRGYIRTGWEFYASGTSRKKGIYANTSGVENATVTQYPTSSCMKCIKAETAGLPEEDIVVKITTDCFGKVLSQCITTQEFGKCVNNSLWQGPNSSSGSAPEYSFTRRIGRITTDETKHVSPEDSTRKNKVISTNDIVMPILPARAEKEEKTVCRHSISLIGNFKENSILIKNIANTGGLCFDTSCQSRVSIKSGVEFHKACVEESTDSCGSSTTTTWPTIPKHLEPQPFEITVACIPIKEQHYSWCKTSNSWVKSLAPSGDSTSEPSTAEPTKKGDIKITAKSLGGNNWQIGWASSGEVEIPVKDFTPSEAITYDEGRGISLCKQTVNDGTEENPVWGSKYVICNTMEICAGCGISVEQTDTEKPAYKINACKMKIEAGDGIKVECITGGYKISACETQAICITNGAGISVTKNNNTFTITNTAIHEAIEVVEGEGIKVTQTGNKYKVSLAAPCCGTGGYKCYIFDPAWFTVTDNNVTINEAKVQAVGDGIAVNTSVNANITRVMERTIAGNGYEGDIMARVNGLEGGLCATARVTWEQGTHSDQG